MIHQIEMELMNYVINYGVLAVWTAINVYERRGILREINTTLQQLRETIKEKKV